MLNILMISDEGEGYDVGVKLASEGNLVKFWVKSDKGKPTGMGVKNPKRIQDVKPHIESADMVLFTMVGMGKAADEMRKRDKVVIGGGKFNDLIELDRKYGVNVAKLTEMDVPENRTFDSVDEAVDYIKGVKWPVVAKPQGNMETSSTVVCDKSNEPAITFLESNKAAIRKGVMVQRKVEGIEVSTEGWFNGKDWVSFNHTIEKKRFMEGDKGPNTGCMGNVVWFCNGRSRLVQQGLKPLTRLLRRQGYVGPLDFNCIVDQNRAWFLEWTARFGYDAIETMMEGLNMDKTQFLWNVAMGLDENPKYHKGRFIGVRLSVKPYPSGEDASHLKGLKMVEFNQSAMKHVWLLDVMEGGALAGVDGQIGCVTASGSSLDMAQDRVYKTIENGVLSRDVQYRSDIAEGIEGKIRTLKKWGWIE